jgi:D-alanine-D-alanine ligase
MDTNKKTVAVLFGGRSAEHDVSLNSAHALYTHMDKEKFEPLFIYIDRQGLWHPMSEESFLKKDFSKTGGYSFLPWQTGFAGQIDADIYFPMLHGPNGEDGRLQALLEMGGKPYVGAGSFSSGLAMDKVVSKTLFKNAGLDIGDYLFFESNDYSIIRDDVNEKLGYPVFVKPCAMGSSVGISKVSAESQLKKAVNLAFRYDRKILVEKGLDIREIEVSVMGNDHIKVSRPGELIPSNEFYDYKDKYIDGKTTFHMPAQVSPAIESEIRRIAGSAYKALFLNGMARVDLFIEKSTGKILMNEINTIPGFTQISMFPKLWTLDGISFTSLITILIDYGFEYFEKTENVDTGLHG